MNTFVALVSVFKSFVHVSCDFTGFTLPTCVTCLLYGKWQMQKSKSIIRSRCEFIFSIISITTSQPSRMHRDASASHLKFLIFNLTFFCFCLSYLRLVFKLRRSNTERIIYISLIEMFGILSNFGTFFNHRNETSHSVAHFDVRIFAKYLPFQKR